MVQILRGDTLDRELDKAVRADVLERRERHGVAPALAVKAARRALG